MQSMEERRLREEQRKNEARMKRRRKRKRQQRIVRGITGVTILAIVLATCFGISRSVKNKETEAEAEGVVTVEETKYIAERPELMVELIDMNQYSRPGTALEKVNGIVVHYTANPGTTAEQNRGYFQGLAESGETYASSHFVIGLSGEIVQCIPCNEIAYASNERNADTISIECCIPDETGRFNDATYASLVHLVAWLMGRYELTSEDVIRHYDVTGKACPKYYVENQWAWDAFKEDVVSYIDTYGIAKTEEIQ